MNYAIRGRAPQLKPERGEHLKRSGAIPMRSESGRRSLAFRSRRHSVPRVWAALSGRRGSGSPPSRASRTSASGGVSPIASGASRGVALLSSR